MEKNHSEESTSTSPAKTEAAKPLAKPLAAKQGNAFGRFYKSNGRPGNAAKPAFFGGRNGAGKPC